MNPAAILSWLFGELGLIPVQFTKGASRRVPSLNASHLKQLAKIYAGYPRVVSSLTMIRRYEAIKYLHRGLKAVADHVDHHTGRVHTSLRDTLATGRISSTGPNLQGIAKRKTIAGVPVRSRNVLMASDGYELVTFDIKLADVRVMANAVASFPRSSLKHLEMLRS